MDDYCPIRPVFQNAQDALRKVLDDASLADLIARKHAEAAGAAADNGGA
jgi:DNA-binding IscR family transcriptional regulator